MFKTTSPVLVAISRISFSFQGMGHTYSRALASNSPLPKVRFSLKSPSSSTLARILSAVDTNVRLYVLSFSDSPCFLPEEEHCRALKLPSPYWQAHFCTARKHSFLALFYFVNFIIFVLHGNRTQTSFFTKGTCSKLLSRTLIYCQVNGQNYLFRHLRDATPCIVKNLLKTEDDPRSPSLNH